MQLTNKILAGYIGGQIEIQNQNEGYMFRGQIKTATIEDEDIVVTLDWMAKGMGYPPIPTNWVNNSTLLYQANLTIYSVSNIGPGSEGDDRISLNSPITGELVVLYPPNGSKLLFELVAFPEVGFAPKADWQKEECLFCKNPATLQAMYTKGNTTSAIRCCENEDCKKRAIETAQLI